MAQITLSGNPIQTTGELPEKGSQAPEFELVKQDLSAAKLSDYQGKKVLMNIYPSIDTGICAMSVRKFNEQAAAMGNTEVLCISRDLPFAQKRFCGAEGIENVTTLSDFASGDFGKKYGLEIADGPMKNLHSRAIIILDENGKVAYTEQVPEIVQEPDYDAALNAFK